MKWLLVLALIVTAGAGLLLVSQERNDRVTPARVADSKQTPGAVGTAGVHDGAAENHSGAVITEIETITGTNDGMSLVGRRVDLHVDVQARATDQAFWVGPRDNRLLVVLRGDRRDGAKHEHGRTNHGIAPVNGGQRATVSGVIRAMPKDEQRDGWSLTRADEQELVDRKIYIDADTVHSEGHGTH